MTTDASAMRKTGSRTGRVDRKKLGSSSSLLDTTSSRSLILITPPSRRPICSLLSSFRPSFRAMKAGRIPRAIPPIILKPRLVPSVSTTMSGPGVGGTRQ